MKLSNILTPVLASVIAICFNACTADDTIGEEITKTENIAINVTCTLDSTADDIATYVTTISGDSIVQDLTNSRVAMFIDSTNEKKVCLVSGRSHIERKLSN